MCCRNAQFVGRLIRAHTVVYALKLNRHFLAAPTVYYGYCANACTLEQHAMHTVAASELMKVGHWTFNPDTSHAGDSGSRKPASAHRRQQHHHRGWKLRADTYIQHNADKKRLQRMSTTCLNNNTARKAGTREVCCSGNVLRPCSPEDNNMKRKSQRRRAESRKKRCAAPSGSEAVPSCDVYIEITGKRVSCRIEPRQLYP